MVAVLVIIASPAAEVVKTRLQLAIEVVTAVTAVILARRKNRSTVIWPVASFVFPPALLPLFARAALPEKNTALLDRKFLPATVSVLILIVGIALIRYGSLHPCDMYAHEIANELVAVGADPEAREIKATAYHSLLAPEQCFVRLLEYFL